MRKKHRKLGASVATQFQNKININQNVPEDKQLVKNIFKQQLRHTRKDIADLVRAISTAENIYEPCREPLLQVFKNIDLESQMSSLIQTRKLKAMGKEYEIVKKSGKRDEDLTKLFQGSWFLDTLGYAWDSILYGYSLVQVGNIVAGAPSGVELFPRQNVRPETQEVVATPWSMQGASFVDNEYGWFFGHRTDLGLLSKLAVLGIYKQHAQAAWAQMVELFGMPLRIGKVNMANKDRAESMFQMLMDMSSAGAGVMDIDDEIEFVETASKGGQNAHKEFMAYLDEQISKLIFGQTMMADNGSSRSQSEVHERVGNDYVLADMKYLERLVNDVVIPKMIAIGYTQLTNCRFQFAKALDTAALFEQVIKAMAQKVPVDLKWFEETFGIKLQKQPDGTQELGSQDAESDTAGAKDASGDKQEVGE